MVEQAGALGYFGGARRAAVGTELLERVTASGSLMIRKLVRRALASWRSIVFCRHRRSAAERCWRPLRGARSRRARVGTPGQINFAGRVANRRFVIGGKPRLLGHSFLPVSLQRLRHQPVLRLGAGSVLA
jgi:hypothetical protein